jgi:hypothetical protein
MENKHIIAILLIIIAILAVAVGMAFLPNSTAKEPTKIKITSDKEQYEDDALLSVKLTDLNKTSISKEIVNITITDSNGKIVIDNVVKTNSKGNGILDLDLNKGTYTVNVTYGGNDKYRGNTTSQKLTIGELEVVEATVEQSSSESGAGTHTIMGEDGYYYVIDDNGNFLENLGPSKKYYPNNPNSVDYPNAESGSLYIDKSK